MYSLWNVKLVAGLNKLKTDVWLNDLLALSFILKKMVILSKLKDLKCCDVTL